MLSFDYFFIVVMFLISVGYFLTKIFHPNIATNGEICVNTLKKDWNPSLGLRHVLLVSSFLEYPVRTYHLLIQLISSYSLNTSCNL